MANITEVSQWENVIRQLENGEAATGGADGLANVQAKQLANRTKWLKENYLPLTGGALTGNALTWNGNDLAGAAIVAKSLGTNGYVKYASGLIIQWKNGKFATFSNGKTRISFPISFSQSPSVSLLGNEVIYSLIDISASGITARANYYYGDKAVVDTGTPWSTLLAIGY